MHFRRLLINTKINDNVMISYAAGKKEIDGIVIGDPFCLKRAGIGVFDIPRLAREAKKRNLFISYQTPVYLTERNFDTILSLIETLVRESLVNEIRIQDLGLLNSMEKIISSGINLTWSIYGYQREFPGMDIPLNQGQIDFLHSKGIDSFEVTSAVAFSIMENSLPLDFRGSKPHVPSPVILGEAKDLSPSSTSHFSLPTSHPPTPTSPISHLNSRRMQIHHYRFDPATFSRNCYTEIYGGKCCCNENRETEPFPCDEPLYLEEDTEAGGRHNRMKYVVEGYRVLEFPDPEEFDALCHSKMNIETLILEGNNIGEIEELLQRFQM